MLQYSMSQVYHYQYYSIYQSHNTSMLEMFAFLVTPLFWQLLEYAHFTNLTNRDFTRQVEKFDKIVLLPCSYVGLEGNFSL